ncbi:MAG: hypothetical protein GC166_05940 [Alphaproteobacteria bacterium]|nr:hypothetical protein [Alphaproteobacteria bacterium]
MSMRFRFGQEYEAVDPGSLGRARVIEVFDDGREALLEFDGEHSERIAFAAFMMAGSWRPVPSNCCA